MSRRLALRSFFACVFAVPCCSYVSQFKISTRPVRPSLDSREGSPSLYGITLCARNCHATERSSVCARCINLLGMVQTGRLLAGRRAMRFLKIGMVGCHGLEPLLTARVLPLAA